MRGVRGVRGAVLGLGLGATLAGCVSPHVASLSERQTVCVWEGELTKEDVAALTKVWGIPPELLIEGGNDIRRQANLPLPDPSKHRHPLCDVSFWFPPFSPWKVLEVLFLPVTTRAYAWCFPDGGTNIVIWQRNTLAHEAAHHTERCMSHAS